MFMTKREEEDRLTVKLTLYKDGLQPKKRPKAAGEEEQQAQEDESAKESAISIVPLQFSRTVLPRPRLLNKESSVNSTKILLRRHPHVPKRNHNVHEFFKAIYQARQQDMLYFLKFVSIRSEDPQDGKTPLMAALHVGNEARRREVFDYLASHGAAFGGRDRLCRRDLIGWAALLGRHEQLRRVLADASEEPDFQQPDAKGLSCLHLAVMSGSLETVDIVLEAMQKLGVGVELQDASGCTPYILARKLGYSRIAQLLQDKGKASAHRHDAVSFRSPREWSAIGRQQRLLQKQRLLQQDNWGVLPLTEEELLELQRPQQPAERGETFVEMAMQSLAPKVAKTSQELVHSALDLWSQQHLPAYRRGAQLPTLPEAPQPHSLRAHQPRHRHRRARQR